MLTILLSAASAHSASVTGTVTEAGAKTPLAAAEVVLLRGADSTVVAHTVTGADGRFRLDSLRVGRYTLRASLLGYVPLVRRDLVLSESAPDLNLGAIALAVSPIPVKGIETSTARATAIIAPDRNIYLTKDMPAASSGTAIDILRTVPELDVDIDGHVSLRGSASVTIQFNGRAAPLKGDALTTYLRQMPASRIERVEVIANPSAKFDPEGMAGIVNLALKDDAGLGVSGSVYATGGNAWSGPGARLAWQKGPVTLFSGLSGNYGISRYTYDVRRLDLLVAPPSAFSSAAATKSLSRYGMADASIDYALTKRSTFYGTVNGYKNGSDTDALTHVITTDSAQTATSWYDRTDGGRYNGHTMSYTLGFQNTIQQGKNERSIEILQSDSDNGRDSHGLQHTFVPSGIDDQISRQQGASGSHERSLEFDDTHPIGAKGKLEVGYRGAERRNTDSGTLRYFVGDSLVVAPLSDASDYEHREVFHSGYVTLGSTFRKLSAQLGARAERAHTTFDVRSAGHAYTYNYRSLFPSANVAWDFGKGRTVRATYSKRIERPQAYYLNPDVPGTDSLNRYFGNPYLGPKYTHSFGLDASWTGTRGSLRFSPYLRKTINNWDQVTRVDAAGAATTTWENASSVRFFGASVTASLRQTGRWGGTLSFSGWREHHDASNLSSQFQREATVWSANGNVTFKTTKTLDLQGYLRYSPAQTLAQGRSSAYLFTNLGARLKLSEKAWANLWIRDPFNLARFSRSTGDATYTQRSSNHNNVRGVSTTLTWTWGKQPEQKQRRQSTEQPTQGDVPGTGR